MGTHFLVFAQIFGFVLKDFSCRIFALLVGMGRCSACDERWMPGPDTGDYGVLVLGNFLFLQPLFS